MGTLYDVILVQMVAQKLTLPNVFKLSLSVLESESFCVILSYKGELKTKKSR